MASVESTPTDSSQDPEKKERSWLRFLPLVILAIAVIYWLLRLVVLGVPQPYEDEKMHFKYGSVGSDNLRRGIPYEIWRVLPDIFPEHLPEGKPRNYEAFGLITDKQDEQDRPIGFSKRWHLGVGDVIGLNCAFCHVSTVRQKPGDTPEIILGMPANTVDLEKFFGFLFTVADDTKFTVENVITAIKQKRLRLNEGRLGYWETFIHRWVVIPATIRGLKNLKHTFSFLDRRPTPFGPGRVETWAAYKVLALQEPFWFMEYTPEWFGPYIDMDAGPVTGLADFPALWQEKIDGGALHWDGNNTNLEERNITAALGAGVTPATLDLESLRRIARWMKSLKPERYHDSAPMGSASPETIDKGKIIFGNHCYNCHEELGGRIREIVPVDVDGRCNNNRGTTAPIETVDVGAPNKSSCDETYIGTDPERLQAFTNKLRDKMNEVRHMSVWRLKNYEKTDGYANMLLTGIWLRAPYLHNGSVPTLWHLLQKPEDRPMIFCRGNDAYDWEKVGFQWNPKKLGEKDACNPFHYYDTTLRGNGNGGHLYGTNLSDQEKRNLIEYLKTL